MNCLSVSSRHQEVSDQHLHQQMTKHHHINAGTAQHQDQASTFTSSAQLMYMNCFTVTSASCFSSIRVVGQTGRRIKLTISLWARQKVKRRQPTRLFFIDKYLLYKKIIKRATETHLSLSQQRQRANFCGSLYTSRQPAGLQARPE